MSTTRLRDLAAHVINAERLGVLDGWRDYLRHEQTQAGISNAEMKAAIEQEKKK